MKKNNKQKDIDYRGKNYISRENNCGLRRSRGFGCNNFDPNPNLPHIANSSPHPSGLNLSEISKQTIRNYIIDLLGNDPMNCYKDIIHDNKFGSLRSISNRLKISRPTLKYYISTWLEIPYGKEEVDDIIKFFWPGDSAKQKEKTKFYEIIEKSLRLYPERISLIPTRNALLKSELQGILSKNTFKPWVIDYLTQIKFYTIDESHTIYDVIWGQQCARRRKIEIGNIKDFVHQRSHGKAHVLTSKTIFELMSEYPTDRYIKISCEEEHTFPIKVRKLIYDYNWCPYCNERLCERVMRNYLEQLFTIEFEVQITLEQAFEIERDKIYTRIIVIDGVKYSIRVFVGQLRYDHYCPRVSVVGEDGGNYQFTVAGEYDSSYHDEEDLRKNPFCDSINDLTTVKARDYVKNDVSCENKVILIRLKEKDGFTRRILMHNQKKVIQEIIQQFNKQIKEFFGLNAVKLSYDPYKRFYPLGEEIPNRIKDSLDDFKEV